MLFRVAYASSSSAKKSGGVRDNGRKDIGGSMNSGYRTTNTPNLAKSTSGTKRRKDIGGPM